LTSQCYNDVIALSLTDSNASGQQHMLTVTE